MTEVATPTRHVTGELFDHEGTFFKFPQPGFTTAHPYAQDTDALKDGMIDGEIVKMRVGPGSFQKPHPPITIGGRGKASFKRVVSLGDGWQVVSEHPDDVYSTEGDLAKDLATLKQMSEEAGRDFQTIEITAVIIAGTAEGVLRDIAQYERIGVSRLILDFPSFVSDPQEMAAILEKVASEAAM